MKTNNKFLPVIKVVIKQIKSKKNKLKSKAVKISGDISVTF